MVAAAARAGECSEQGISLNRHNTLNCLSTELTQLQTLSEALTEISTELTRVEHKTVPFDERTATFERLTVRLDGLADDHQSYLHERNKEDEFFTSKIIYAELDVDHPGLAALGSIRTQLETLHEDHWDGTL